MGSHWLGVRQLTFLSLHVRFSTHCSDWKSVHAEIKRSTDVLLTNGYSKNEIEKQTNRILDNWYNNKENNKVEYVKLHYKSHFSTKYTEDERIMKQIVKKNVTPSDPNKKLLFTIYYKNKKTSDLLLRTSPKKKKKKKKKGPFFWKKPQKKKKKKKKKK